VPPAAAGMDYSSYSAKRGAPGQDSRRLPTGSTVGARKVLVASWSADMPVAPAVDRRSHLYDSGKAAVMMRRPDSERFGSGSIVIEMALIRMGSNLRFLEMNLDHPASLVVPRRRSIAKIEVVPAENLTYRMDCLRPAVKSFLACD